MFIVKLKFLWLVPIQGTLPVTFKKNFKRFGDFVTLPKKALKTLKNKYKKLVPIKLVLEFQLKINSLLYFYSE